MIQLTSNIKDVLDKALADGTPCLLGTASKDGRPQISPKGSVTVFDEQRLCFWERSLRSSDANLKGNPHVVVYYRNPARASEFPGGRGATLRFHGTARVASDERTRERAWELTIPAEKERDPEKKGHAVIIEVELVEDLSGAVVMKRD